MSTSNYLFEATADNFDAVVVENSYRVPVLVDFWAEWCAPCKMLMPVLEALSEAYQGKFLVAKVDTEREQQLAAAHGIRSIPTLKLYKDGQAVEEVHGALPEATLRELIDRYIVRESDLVLKQARETYANGDAEAALDLLRNAAEQEPDNYDIRVEQLRILVQERRLSEARTLAQTLPLNITESSDVSAVLSELEFAEAVADAPSATELAQRLEANPGDSKTRFQLAARLVLERQYEAALAEFLQLLQRDRHYGEEAGRRGMIAVFNLLGGEGELVSTYRRRMFNALH